MTEFPRTNGGPHPTLPSRGDLVTTASEPKWEFFWVDSVWVANISFMIHDGLWDCSPYTLRLAPSADKMHEVN